MGRRKNKLKKDPFLTPTGETLRINMIGRHLRETFGRRVVKLSLDAGFTCPNRDGTLGTDGCLFCSPEGGSFFASSIEGQIELLSRKWPDASYLAYFQNYTNTYAPVDKLRELYGRALSVPGICGLAIATRPDCLPNDVLELLSQIRAEHYLWVELGLQTVHEKTAEIVGRGYPLHVFDKAMAALRSRGIPVVVHLILGLPGETQDDMLASARYVADCGAWGIKLHLLNVIQGSRLAETMPDYVPFSSMEEYVSLVCDILEILPEKMVIHRLTGDTSRKKLIAPSWSYQKRTILNMIDQTMRRRGTKQGTRYSVD